MFSSMVGFNFLNEFFLFPLSGKLQPILATATETEVEPAMVVAGVLLSLVAIYIASKAGGEFFNWLGFPPVLGELVGGVVIGISALNLVIFPESGADSSTSVVISILEATAGLAPDAAEATFQVQSEVLEVLSELGVIILLFEIGLESNIRDLMQVGIQSLIVAIVGVTLPFVAGTAGMMMIFHVSAVPAIFAGAALTATSIGITSRVLAEINRLNTQEGQIILGAAVIDDVLGIIILAVVASLAKTGEVDVVNAIYLIISASVFLVGAILLGRFFNDTFVFFGEKFKTRGRAVIPALTIALFMSYIGTAIHLEAILGAFAAGLVLDNLDQTEVGRELEELIRPISDVVVPIFFVTVGTKTNLGVLNPAIPTNREGLVIAIFLIVVAIVGKVACGFSVFGLDNINRLAVGVGMVPRGEVGLVFASVGSASGALSPALDVAIILMVIITTFLAPPLLRVVFGEGEAEEVTETSG
ncbi:MAG: cation:proton antiporter [Okeania sp. SIO2G4]|uniref:cation:proton antiporter n=1 Tax=unclassified Okeania TaxID=2634635 RepID=UPI0013B639A1|nr:cation:proton antiporter [Okeania sp. SIO4D6]NEP73073.1 cation:proton antiporter [Okeania sp. SIO2G5]NEP93961.1 cation:proton antiporter [Okeania sp. SIO2F5]NEQ93823.1 cation:proton antiporter [Okeania sp. SIO2G4]